MSPTQRGVLKGLRLARDLARAQAKAAKRAASARLVLSKEEGPVGDAERWSQRVAQYQRGQFAMAHAQALGAYVRKLDREINRAMGAQEELLP